MDRTRHDKGFTLIEVLAALVILTIIIMSIFSLLTFTNKAATANNDQIVAVNLAKMTIERMRLQPEDFNIRADTLPEDTSNGFDTIIFDASICQNEAVCLALYEANLNNNLYDIRVEMSQSNEKQELASQTNENNKEYSEAELYLINVKVHVKLRDSEISSIAEGYIHEPIAKLPKP